MISRGVPMGAVQVPPTDGLLVLLRGRLVTAGYPVLGVATTVAVDRLAQARPGDRIRFRPSTTTEALADVRRQAAALAELERRVHAALRASGVERLH
jgi:allophanate hydrolase subunit 2